MTPRFSGRARRGPLREMQPAAGQLAPTVLGVPLAPGERVVAFERPTADVFPGCLVVAGVVMMALAALAGALGLLVEASVARAAFLVVTGVSMAIGAALFWAGRRSAAQSCRSFAVTTARVVHQSQQGTVVVVPWSDVADVDVVRGSSGDADSLILLTVLGVVKFFAHRRAAKKPRVDPGYWEDTFAIAVRTRAGKMLRLQPGKAKPSVLGPMLVRAREDPTELAGQPSVPHDP